MHGLDEKDKERTRAQLAIIQETSSKRWDILLFALSLTTAVAALVQGDLLQPKWLVRIIVLLSLISIPIVLGLYERSLTEKQLISEEILQSIFNENGLDMRKKLNEFRGGWSSWLPRGSVYLVSPIIGMMVIGVLVGWRRDVHGSMLVGLNSATSTILSINHQFSLNELWSGFIDWANRWQDLLGSALGSLVALWWHVHVLTFAHTDYDKSE